MHILTILGARPQFIKHSMIQRQFKNKGIKETLLHTGQHYDPSMSAIFFHELGISSPQIFLQTQESDSLMQLGLMLSQMSQIFHHDTFDYVLVYGDTTSTLAGSLFARERKIPLVHIEAGLRSGDLDMPEERNRVICDHLSKLLFVPTKNALWNLKQEKVKGKIILSGDVMKDAFLHFSSLAKCPSGVEIPRDFILCTLHRQSNVDSKERLEFLLEGLSKVSLKMPVLFLIHPRTKKRLEEFALKLPASIIPLPPQGYLQTLWLLTHCFCVFTDSGGLQKEAYFAQKKCLILRDVSEWNELIESQASLLLKSNEVDEAYGHLLDLKIKEDLLYGDGKSAQIIVQSLM